MSRPLTRRSSQESLDREPERLVFLNRLLRSDTATTWVSLFVRVGGGFVLLLAAARVLSPDVVAVWLLFRVILGLRILAESGLGTTYARVIAFAVGGADDIGDLRGPSTREGSRDPNWALVDAIWRSMGRVYAVAGGIALGVLGFVITPLLYRSIALLPSVTEGWVAWAVMALSFTAVLWGARYVVFLLGVGEVALVRRWEAVVRTGALAAGLSVLFSGGGLLGLVITMQGFEMGLVGLNALLVRRVRGRTPVSLDGTMPTDRVTAVVLPRAWRNAVGVSLFTGLNQLSSLVLAQLFTGAELASYLIAFRLFDSVNMFSMAPFYSKLPQLARLHGAGERTHEVALARSRMFQALGAYAVGCSVLVLAGPVLFRALAIDVPFANATLATLLALAFFAERLGAMHLQLYTVTNHEVGHVYNGAYAVIYVIAAVFLVPPLGLYGFPSAMLLAHVVFPLWYSLMLTRREFALGFRAFHLAVTAPPLLLLLAALFGMRLFAGS